MSASRALATCCVFCLSWAGLNQSRVVAQETFQIAPGQVVQPGQVVAQPPMPVQPMPGQPVPNQPMAKPGNPAATPPKVNKPKSPNVVTRPEKPETPPDPSEFDVVPKDGKLRISFTGQPWPHVLRWLKQVSGKTLDWQELPAGYLNLTTKQEYTVDQITDLINRHLLARGFTILINGEMITVENIKKLNLALVPRVQPADLKTLPDNTFVKVSFPLNWMLAADAVAEFKPMLTNNGKMFPLKKTNRIEAVDSAKSLREIWDLFSQEQSSDGEKHLVQKFDLTHVRAEEMVASLKELMGLEQSKKPKGRQPQGPEQAQMAQMMAMQMAAQGGEGAPQAVPKKGRSDDIFIIASNRGNAVIVNAPPDKMKTIEQAINALDKAEDVAGRLHGSLERTEVYRLVNLDPETFITTLREIGGLSPSAKVHVDKVRKAIVLSGDKTDHLVVEMLSKKLDGASRKFYVVNLRRMPADYVAGSIRFMMGTETKQTQQQPRRSFFMGFGPQQQEKKDTRDEFRVEGDVEYQRLLLWCNELEYQQIEELLKKLGEIQLPGQNASRRRSFDSDSLEDALKLLQRTEQTWKQRGGNALDIELPGREPGQKRTNPISPDQLEPVEIRDKSASTTTKAKPSRPSFIHFVQNISQNDDTEPITPPGSNQEAKSVPLEEANDNRLETPVDEQERLRILMEQLRKRRQAADQQRGQPIRIQLDNNGRIYFESDDTLALDQLEMLLEDLAPPRRDWKLFKLKNPNTYALGVELILRDVFKEEMGTEKRNTMEWDPFWGITPAQKDVSSPRRLSKRKPLKIISDEDSHTILVQGATRDQLRTIEELISIYDQPQSLDAQLIRRTKVLKIRYSSAAVIAEALKDVYRDLLSANDKALQNGKQKDEKDTRRDDGMSFLFGPRKEQGGDESKERERVRFKGQLSIGIDTVSNTLIVSAAGGLLDNISQIVEALDEAANPKSSVHVLQLDPRVDSTVLQKKLERIFGKKLKTQTQQPATPKQDKPANVQSPMAPQP